MTECLRHTFQSESSVQCLPLGLPFGVHTEPGLHAGGGLQDGGGLDSGASDNQSSPRETALTREKYEDHVYSSVQSVRTEVYPTTA